MGGHKKKRFCYPYEVSASPKTWKCEVNMKNIPQKLKNEKKRIILTKFVRTDRHDKKKKRQSNSECRTASSEQQMTKVKKGWNDKQMKDVLRKEV